MLLFMLMFFMEIRVMLLSFSLVPAEQLSDTMELPGFCLSSESFERLHLNLRLTTLTRMITTTTRITMKLMTPKAATVSGDFSYVRVVPEVSSVGVTASEVLVLVSETRERAP